MLASHPPRPSRRRFLRTGALAAGGWSVSRRRTLLDAQSPDPVLLPTFVADTDGNGRLGPADERLVQDALFTRRGFGLTPLPGFDVRADIFGRGSVGQLAVDSVRHTLEVQTAGGVQVEPRPITVAWHYGWYNVLTRPPWLQTVRFKGGNYTSRDPEVETLFNNQKNEFGITIDALSWIPQRFNANLLDNYRRGLLSTANLGTRYLALLYESTIALPLGGGRIDFSNPSVPLLLREDFEQMARFLAEARDQSGGRVFTLDGRPVVFIFGSHTWGLLPVESAQFGALEIALDVAREAFRDRFGGVPFLVGEEMTLSSGGTFSEDRARRMTNFDATFTYHHAPLKPLSAPGLEATLFLSPPIRGTSARYPAAQLPRGRHRAESLYGQPCARHSQPRAWIREAGPAGAQDGSPRLRRFHEGDTRGASRLARPGTLAPDPGDRPLASAHLHRGLLERGVRRPRGLSS